MQLGPKLESNAIKQSGQDNSNFGRFRGGAAVDCDGRSVHISESDGGSQLAGLSERQQLVRYARIMPKLVGASCAVPQQVHFFFGLIERTRRGSSPGDREKNCQCDRPYLRFLATSWARVSLEKQIQQREVTGKVRA